MMLKAKQFTLVLCLIFSSFLKAQEVSDTKFGKGMINFIAKDSSFSVKFAPRIQSRYQGQWDYD
ncbi:MAG: porin, partial [Flavobacteriaceae bacterium]